MPEVAVESPDPAAAEAALVERLRAGDEAAFEALVARHYATMIAVAQTYVKGRAVAEEVVQDAWLGVINGLDRFEGRSSLKTWILSILVNQADRKSTRLNSSHVAISYAVFCLKKKKKHNSEHSDDKKKKQTN